MREGSLVAFTVLTQAAVGVAVVLTAVRLWAERSGAGEALGSATFPLLLGALVAALFGLAASFLHLGRARNAWRALGNLRSSWLSREILFASAFAFALSASVLLRLRPGSPGFGVGFADGFGVVIGVGLLQAMATAYRLRTVPAWNGAATPVAFFGTALALGCLGVAAGLAFAGPPGPSLAQAVRFLVLVAVAVLVTEAAALLLWLRRLAASGGAGRESFVRAGRERRSLLAARLVLAFLAVAASTTALLVPGSAVALVAALLLAVLAEATGRALFYEARVRAGL